MTLFKTYQYDETGYQKLFHFKDWRIAILNYIDELEVENISYVEAHLDTDEAFVLLDGSATLIFAVIENNLISGFESVELEPHKVYSIPSGVYHTHTLSKNAKLLIIEEENTSDHNSKRIYFDELSKITFIKQFGEK